MKEKRSHKKKPPAAAVEDIRTVHRVTDEGPHRIEIHSPDKEPEIGKWAERHEIAQLHHFRATSPQFACVFPKFFKIVHVPHRNVSDSRSEKFVVMGPDQKNK